MAIDQFIFDTYKQYKAGTNRITTWLASRAREIKALDDLFPSTETKGKGRLKGETRATQKAAQMEKGQIYHLPLSAIPRIAKAIAGKGLAVPGTIVRTLEEVIAARMACNQCFE
jgi:Family of unknown function (DUF6604)